MTTLAVASSRQGQNLSLRSASDVRQEIEARSETIYTAYDTLHKILERHEATLSKRWLKRTRQQRLKVLLEAWPDMPVVHRPDLDVWRKACNGKRERGPRFRDSLVWPYINQEDLVSPKAILLLLHSRGRYPPSSFAAADAVAMTFGLVSQMLMPDYLKDTSTCYMALNGFDENTRQYGELVICDDAKGFGRKVLKQFTPGHGLLVLEAQARLLTFLVKCCRQLLPDIPVGDFDAFPILPPPQIKTESEVSGFESLRLMAAEAPYRVPAQLDLGRIESLLAARTSAAEDHLWALREDPEYFASAVLGLKEHRPEMLKDLRGRDHPDLRHSRKNVFWGRVLAPVVGNAYLNVEIFHQLSQQARALVSLQHQYAAQISPSQDLPEEFLTALLRLRHDLDEAIANPLHMLRETFRPSPPFRRFFVRRQPHDPDFSQGAVGARPGAKPTAVEQKLLWLLENMFGNQLVLTLAGAPLIMDEVERLLEDEPGARDLITPWLAGLIGDLSILTKCLGELALYQPWARSWVHSSVAHKWFEEDYKKMTQPMCQIFDKIGEAILDTKDASQAVVLGDPSGGQFAYPIEKRRTKENVAILRQAEARLDAFWRLIDEALADRLPGTASHKALFSQSCGLQRTPEWEEPTPKPRPQPAAQPKSDSTSPYTSFLPSWLFPSSADDTSTAQRPKTKVKTRGTARSASTQDHGAEALLEPIGAETQPAFSVDARSLKVFRSLFHDPELTSTPGEVRWNDFLHAMKSIGFAGIQLYGSVWQFEPTVFDLERSIQFHEPHPSGKMPYTMARRIGRRLNRAYGWHGGMFVLANSKE
ncbi:hypothetical protein ASPACDRAFT_35201 [Aspergillus aculeatus ATCC 16872]|uniref:Uncharacterized protein n=1 Tax=Aspergillus aculeatus (strain ATCC 16872 / CBS 172.66 / WB 5094) TaxID=690307 RepID=A0A1L9WIF0_ASPA1|nr:uncharacterized protein ASPACDRAFT_35201 [Aspergillus aculeatus ATCC 16872]OJJ95933.1 hypothetical protein ASPACDRAFT_35201 [Aspergillus aculeatus ATCC 16872]